MTITITLYELVIGILILLGIAALAALTMTLLKVYGILKKTKDILDKNEKNIDDSIAEIPKVLHNVEEITSSVNEEMKHLQGAIKSIEETVGYAASTAQMVTEDIVEPIGEVLQLLNMLRGLFFKDKKKGWFK